MLLRIKTTALWAQFEERNASELVKVRTLPATAENFYFDQYPVDQDTYEEYLADRWEMIEKYGTPRWQVMDDSQAAREAFLIGRYERTGKRKQELIDAGYAIPDEDSDAQADD